MIDNLIDSAIDRSRTTLSIMGFLLFIGIIAYRSIPVALEPDIEVPFVVITILHEGISPEDAKRLLVLPTEEEVRALEGVEEITSYASEGVGTISIEFDINISPDDAVIDVREAVDRARVKMPNTIEEPIISKVSTADYPTLVINFASNGVSERTLYQLAQALQHDIEGIPSVLEARLSGHREELLEVVIDSVLLESYSISTEQLINAVRSNNRLIAAGALDTGRGRFAIKVPGLIETKEDLYGIPIKTSGDSVITLEQIATIRRTFKDHTSYAYVNGLRSISVEVIKRLDANIIDTSKEVKKLVEERQQSYPKSVNIFYTSDTAPTAEQQVNELIGNVLTAMMLVMIMVIAALGFRSGLLVSFGIPISFLFSYILLDAIGYSFNFMVMFGLLLALGMLIDGAIVVSEYADRRMTAGEDKKSAYSIAAKRMFWPVVASTATTLAAFLPLFLWPGVSGKFMLYLPVTVFTVLIGSLAYALFFAPTIGALVGKAGSYDEKSLHRLNLLENGDPTQLDGWTGVYARILAIMAKWPISVTFGTMGLLMGAFTLYGAKGTGVIFYTDNDARWATVSINAKGNLAVDEIRDLIIDVQQEVISTPGVKNAYAKSKDSLSRFFGGRTPEAQIGQMFLELHSPRERATSGNEVLEEIRRRTKHLAGISIEVKKQSSGPPTGKAVQIQVSSQYSELLPPVIDHIRQYLETQVDGLRDIEDTKSLPGIQWELVVDRARASQVNANISVIGQAVQLVTNGAWLGEYHPDDSNTEVDIRVRFPKHERGLTALDKLTLTTPYGPAAVSSFVDLQPQPKVGTIQRINGSEVKFIRADVLPGILADDKVKEVRAWLNDQPFDPRVSFTFRGASEEQTDASAFLFVAFLLALFIMFIMLVAQFNNFYQAFLIMFAVVMSTSGVLLGLVVTNSPFSVILTGVGIIALAGIVVNNNIVLIDTFNYIRAEHPALSVEEVIIRTGTQRLRPVILTSVTTIFGLLPIANHLSIDLINRQITYGGATTAAWVPLAQAIVSGLLLATVLTLLSTPALLALPKRLSQLVKSLQPSRPDVTTVPTHPTL